MLAIFDKPDPLDGPFFEETIYVTPSRLPRDVQRAIANVEEVTITAHITQHLVPVPEGAAYLGFIFARAETPEQVERALRESHSRLRLVIE